MKRLGITFILLLFTSGLGLQSCGTSSLMFGEPSSQEVIYTLQKLLNSSTLRTLSKLQNMDDGGLISLLPEEIQPVLGILKSTGAIKDIDEIEAKLSKISKDVALESGEIMADAIKEVDFGDGVSILLGGKDAATRVMKSALYETTKKRYSTKIQQELIELEPNINTYWVAGSSAYNLLAKNKVNSSLPDFLAERAVDLLFISIGENESLIRDQPQQLGDQIVNKVFEYYKNR